MRFLHDACCSCFWFRRRLGPGVAADHCAGCLKVCGAMVAAVALEYSLAQHRDQLARVLRKEAVVELVPLDYEVIGDVTLWAMNGIFQPAMEGTHRQLADGVGAGTHCGNGELHWPPLRKRFALANSSRSSGVFRFSRRCPSRCSSASSVSASGLVLLSATSRHMLYGLAPRRVISRSARPPMARMSAASPNSSSSNALMAVDTICGRWLTHAQRTSCRSASRSIVLLPNF